MKINKIVEKITKYFQQDRLKSSQQEKLLKIIEELKDKKSNIKKEISELNKCESEKKKQLEKKLFALTRLIESSKELLKD